MGSNYVESMSMKRTENHLGKKNLSLQQFFSHFTAFSDNRIAKAYEEHGER